MFTPDSILLLEVEIFTSLWWVMSWFPVQQLSTVFYTDSHKLIGHRGELHK